MSKITWDAAGSRYFEYGNKYGVLYVKDTTSSTASSNPYPKGVAWNGIVSVSESPEGAEANELWADDIKYGSIRSAETLKFSIEAYTYPDEFGQCDGSVEFSTTSGETTTGLGVFALQQPRKEFGFCYRTQIGNDNSDELGYKLHLIYGCTASPAERSYETINDSPDAITFSWDIDTTPVTITGLSGFKPTSELIIDSRKVSAANLTALENKLYGTDGTGSTGTDPSLPTPDQVITLLTTST